MVRIAKHVDSVKATPPDHHLTAAHDESQSQNTMSEKPWDQLELALIHTIYGPNMIEKAGTSHKITGTLCRAVFRDGDVIVNLGEADPTYTVHNKLTLIDLGRDSSRDSVINHVRAFHYMAECVILNDEPIKEGMIRETHRILAAGIHANDELVLGQYRTHKVAVLYDNGRASRTMYARHVSRKMVQMVADLAAHEDVTAAASSVAGSPVPPSFCLHSPVCGRKRSSCPHPDQCGAAQAGRAGCASLG